MYNLIFYFIYRGQINQKNTGPWVARCIRSMIVALFLFVHIGFIYSLIRFVLSHFYSINIAFSSGKSHNTKILFWFPIALFLIVGVFKYFNKKRLNQLLENYEVKQFSYSLYNIFKFIMIFIFPLVIAIWMVRRS